MNPIKNFRLPSSQEKPRRKFIQQLLGFSAGFLFIAQTSCHQSTEEKAEKQPNLDFCEDFSGLSEAELKLRENFGYTKTSTLADTQCDNCNLWIPVESQEKCGNCVLFKGPVYAEGHCTYWAPQV